VRWVRPTSSPGGRASSAKRPARRQLTPLRTLRTDRARSKPLKSSILPPGQQRTSDPALPLSLGRVVNPAEVTPAAWTWTRGGWLGRYPNNFSHASCRPARSDSDRIRTNRRPHRHCDDDGTVVARRRRRRHVDQAVKYDQYLHAVSEAWVVMPVASRRPPASPFARAPAGCSRQAHSTTGNARV